MWKHVCPRTRLTLRCSSVTFRRPPSDAIVKVDGELGSPIRGSDSIFASDGICWPVRCSPSRVARRVARSITFGRFSVSFGLSQSLSFGQRSSTSIGLCTRYLLHHSTAFAASQEEEDREKKNQTTDLLFLQQQQQQHSSTSFCSPISPSPLFLLVILEYINNRQNGTVRSLSESSNSN